MFRFKTQTADSIQFHRKPTPVRHQFAAALPIYHIFARNIIFHDYSLTSASFDVEGIERYYIFLYVIFFKFN